MSSNIHASRKWYQFMLDIAWPELIVIGIVAVVAIGPKDLPKVMNTMGKFVGKARMMAADMQRSMQQLNFEADAAERMQKETPAPAHNKHAVPPVKPATPVENPHDHLGNT